MIILKKFNLSSFRTITDNVSFPKGIIISFDLEADNILDDYSNLIFYQNKLLIYWSIILN